MITYTHIQSFAMVSNARTVHTYARTLTSIMASTLHAITYCLDLDNMSVAQTDLDTDRRQLLLLLSHFDLDVFLPQALRQKLERISSRAASGLAKHFEGNNLNKIDLKSESSRLSTERLSAHALAVDSPANIAQSPPVWLPASAPAS